MSAPESPTVTYTFGDPFVTFKFLSGNVAFAENGDPEDYKSNSPSQIRKE